jgi:hypothetical protein
MIHVNTTHYLSLLKVFRYLHQCRCSEKGFGPIDEITVNIAIDLTRIAEIAAATWLASKIGPHLIALGRNRNLNIDHSSKDDTNTIRAITHEIQNQQDNHSQPERIAETKLPRSD